jgi:hypothetical protein
MDLYMKEKEGKPMLTAKAGAQCRVPVPSPPRRHGGRRGRWGQARLVVAGEANGAVSHRAKSLVNTFDQCKPNLLSKVVGGSE